MSPALAFGLTLAVALAAAGALRWWIGGASAGTLDRWDAALAVLSGALLLGLCAWAWRGGGWVGSDVAEFCQGVGEARLGQTPGTDKRGRLVAWALGALAVPLGVRGALVAGAWGSLFLGGAALYLWGRAASGRTAGVLAAALCAAVPAVAELAHTLSFYPELFAAVVLAGAGATVAMRWPTPWGVAVGMVGATAALVADVRTLPWGLVALGVTAIAAGWSATGEGGWRAPLVLALGVVGSLCLGRLAFGEDALGLAHQLDMTRLQRLRELGLPATPVTTSRWTWGRMGALDEVRGVLAVLHGMPEQATSLHTVARVREREVGPWVPWMVAAPLGLVAFRRRPVQGLGTLVLVAPSVLALVQTARVQDAPRFLALGLPVLTLGAALLLGEVLADRPGEGPQSLNRPLLAGGVAALLVLGVPPSWLGPRAVWRASERGPSVSVVRLEDSLDRARRGEARPRDLYERRCVGALLQDER